VREFSGDANSNRLVEALKYLRTFRSTGASCPSCVQGALALISIFPHRTGLSSIPKTQYPRTRIDGTPVQDRAPHEANRQEEHQGGRNNAPVPSALHEGQVLVGPEQLLKSSFAA